jgi:hypothetical protein
MKEEGPLLKTKNHEGGRTSVKTKNHEGGRTSVKTKNHEGDGPQKNQK